MKAKHIILVIIGVLTLGFVIHLLKGKKHAKLDKWSQGHSSIKHRR